jgi:hypothetical protein
MRFAILATIWLGLAGVAPALDHVIFVHDGKENRVSGRIVVKAQDGGLMLMSADGRLWTVPPPSSPVSSWNLGNRE